MRSDWKLRLPLFIRSRKILKDLMHPEDGWEPVAGIADITGFPPKFVSSNQEKNRLMIRFFRLQRDGSLRGKVWFGPLCEGPPGTAHGGSVAAVLDEAMGQAGWIAGHQVVAAKIEVNFRKRVPIENIYRIVASVRQVDGRKVYIEGKITNQDGIILADSSGLFIILQPEERIARDHPVDRSLT